MKTADRLADALLAADLPALAARARAGEFSDFESESPTPRIDLARALRVALQHSRDGQRELLEDLVRDVDAGKYDETKEEADAWMREAEKHDPGLAAFAAAVRGGKA